MLLKADSKLGSPLDASSKEAMALAYPLRSVGASRLLVQALRLE